MIEYTKRNFLDVRVPKEILKLEYDIKNRLSKFGLYDLSCDLKPNNINNSFNLKIQENAFILKLILMSIFYENLFIPRFEHYNNTLNFDNNQSNQSLFVRKSKFCELNDLKNIISNIIKPLNLSIFFYFFTFINILII